MTLTEEVVAGVEECPRTGAPAALGWFGAQGAVRGGGGGPCAAETPPASKFSGRAKGRLGRSFGFSSRLARVVFLKSCFAKLFLFQTFPTDFRRHTC